MARTRNPLSAEQASGKFGPQAVFKQRRTVGTVARASVTPNPKTPAQVSARLNFAAVTKTWATLSPSQVQAWADFAAAHPVSDRFGSPLVLPGYDAFVKCSLDLRRFTGNPAYQPIPANAGQQLSGVSASQPSSNIVEISWVWPSPAIGGWWVQTWKQGPLANANRALREPEQRRVGGVSFPGASASFGGLFLALGWYYFGVQLIPPGAYPGPVAWLGPFELT